MESEKLQHKKRESLSRALEALNKKYHKDAVSIGIIPKTLSGHVGTKIAFSRVPDMDEFTEG
jgi:DNA polymerase-4